MKGISVIICCYNSGDKLLATLAHLAKQQTLNAVPYELLIVDNRCTDDTINTALRTWKELRNPFPQIIVVEEKAGLSFAREAGIKNSKYSYVVLCDDDNWLCEHYLQTVYKLFESMPEVALIGGVGEAVSATKLPQWFDAVEGFGYAVGKEGRSTGYVESVYGAGMALRKEIFNLIIKDVHFILTDRKGKNLSSGGDAEISIRINNAGFKIYLDERLKFKHFLNADRLKWLYYIQLRKSFGSANALLQMEEGDMPLKNKLHAILSYTKYALRHFHYVLLPGFFKNKSCAQFVQESSRRRTFVAKLNY